MTRAEPLQLSATHRLKFYNIVRRLLYYILNVLDNDVIAA